MAFQEASKKTQRALRRVIPKMLGDFVDDNPLTIEEQKEVLVKRRNMARAELETLAKCAENYARRKELGITMFNIQGEIAGLNKQIKINKLPQETCMNNYLLQVSREMLGEQWPDCVAEARLRARQYGFRKDKK